MKKANTPTSRRSHLARVRGLGSAGHGVHHWWVQRLTAMALIPLTIWFSVSLALLSNASHGEMIAWLQMPQNLIGVFLVVVVAFYHSYLGLQVVIEDYVADQGRKLASLICTQFAMVLFALIAMYNLLKIGF